MAGPKYFVTQEVHSLDFHPFHIGASETSQPAILARQVVLYQGENEALAREIARNLIRGRLSFYNLDGGVVNFYRELYVNGRLAGSSLLFDLSCQDPIGDLESTLRNSRQSRMDFFAAFSPQEMQYVESLRASRSTRRAATEPMGT